MTRLNLPRRQQVPGTLGRVYEGREGKGFRPSMFLTLTLPSYGRVLNGVPVNPDDLRLSVGGAGCAALLQARSTGSCRTFAGWRAGMSSTSRRSSRNGG